MTSFKVTKINGNKNFKTDEQKLKNKRHIVIILDLKKTIGKKITFISHYNNSLGLVPYTNITFVPKIHDDSIVTVFYVV